jgi:hypothetical protein
MQIAIGLLGLAVHARDLGTRNQSAMFTRHLCIYVFISFSCECIMQQHRAGTHIAVWGFASLRSAFYLCALCSGG